MDVLNINIDYADEEILDIIKEEYLKKLNLKDEDEFEFKDYDVENILENLECLLKDYYYTFVSNLNEDETENITLYFIIKINNEYYVCYEQHVLCYDKDYIEYGNYIHNYNYFVIDNNLKDTIKKIINEYKKKYSNKIKIKDDIINTIKDIL